MPFPPNVASKIETRFRDLISEGEALVSTMEQDDVRTRANSQMVILAEISYRPEEFNSFRTKVESLLNYLGGRQAQRVADLRKVRNNIHGTRWIIGLLKALSDDFINGFLENVILEVEAGELTDPIVAPAPAPSPLATPESRERAVHTRSNGKNERNVNMREFAPTSESDGAVADEPTDVALLIALREEWEVFWPIAGSPRGVMDPVSSRYLHRFTVPCAIGRPYRCVALCMGEMGPGQATDATHVLLQARPCTLVNLGIAAAIHEDLKLCDVVVADQVDDYLATVKAAARGKKGYTFQLRGSVYKSSYSLVQGVDNLKFAHPEAYTAWHAACTAAMAERAEKTARAQKAGQLRERPGIARVHLASGPVLAAAEAFSQWVRERDGLLKALEMEAAGMMLAAHQRSDLTSTLVLRGISDFGDARKAKTDRNSGGAFRYLAMFNATRLLWSLLRSGILSRHEPTRCTTGSVDAV